MHPDILVSLLKTAFRYPKPSPVQAHPEWQDYFWLSHFLHPYKCLEIILENSVKRGTCSLIWTQDYVVFVWASQLSEHFFCILTYLCTEIQFSVICFDFCSTFIYDLRNPKGHSHLTNCGMFNSVSWITWSTDKFRKMWPLFRDLCIFTV